MLNEENHHVLHADQTKFVEVFESVVDMALVRNDMPHVPKVGTLKHVECHDEPDLVVLEGKECDHKEEAPNTEKESVHQRPYFLCIEAAVDRDILALEVLFFKLIQSSKQEYCN